MGRIVFLVYVDDRILIGKYPSDIDGIVVQLRKMYQLTNKGNIEDYLGIHVEHLPDGRIKLSQPQFIAQILKDVHLSRNICRKQEPAVSSRILQRCENYLLSTPKLQYRSVVGKLNFLEKDSRPDIAYAVHQCTRFSEDPK